MINWIRSLLFTLVFHTVTGVMCCIMLWALPLPKKYMLLVVKIWLTQVSWIEHYVGGFSYQIIGKEYIPEGACIIAAKHQSAWETFKIPLLFRDPAIVLKKELLSVPVWGWYLRQAGMIPIDRKAGPAALSSMMQAARLAVVANRKIVIFPQGTRIPPGEDRPYKSGVASLYKELKLPVIPMALNSGMFWPKGSFVKKPGMITIEFLPPIMPGLPRDEFLTRLKNDLDGTSNRLLTV